MFSHITVGANDMGASKAFYDATFAAIGAAPGMIDDRGRLIYRHNGAMLMVTEPINGEPACHANGGTIGFAMESSEQADAWHTAGCKAGGTGCEEAPGIRETPFGPLYLAYLRDPAGNKLCGLHRAG